MPTIDPKITFWLGVLTTVFIGISSGTIHLTNMIPETWIPTVTAWSAFFAFMNSAFLTAAAGFSSSARGPIAKLIDPPKAVVAILAIGMSVLAFGWATPADAQENRAGRLPPLINPLNQNKPQRLTSPQDIAAAIDKLFLPDFQYASALAHATGNKVTAPCWDAWVKLIQARQQQLTGPDGQPLIKPDPHLVTDLELLSEMLRQLQPDSDISVGCGAMASATTKDIGTFVNTILTGGGITGLIPITPLLGGL